MQAAIVGWECWAWPGPPPLMRLMNDGERCGRTPGMSRAQAACGALCPACGARWPACGARWPAPVAPHSPPRAAHQPMPGQEELGGAATALPHNVVVSTSYKETRIMIPFAIIYGEHDTAS